MLKINVHSKSVDAAMKTLTEQLDTNSTHYDDDILFEKAFENEYHCTIINDDEFGLIGHIEFNEEKYETAFLLRFGGNDKPRKWQAI